MLKKLKRPLLYIAVGGIAFLINKGLFFLLSKIMDVLYANIIAGFTCIVFAYFGNRILVFPEDAHEGKAAYKEAVFFILGRLIMVAAEEVIIWFGVKVMEISETIVKIVGQVVVIIGNYFISKLIVFRAD